MPQGDQSKPAKEEKIEVRVDADLAEKAREKAESRGWSLSSVVRALLALWVDEDVIAPSDVGTAAKRASRSKKRKTGESKKDAPKK